ncbi:MAG TPA: alpha/beta hydrolase [Acidimicrobiia bacterium]|nr:alpha/beta hydrolase [Acidimicrobiia bacterium]
MIEGMAADPRSMSIRLQDGRRLGYADLGDPDGHPMFYFHGWPGSRLDPIPVIGAAERAGVRLLSVDRPGFGLSDPSPGRALSDWPKDVGHLADHLHLDRFSVVGWSGGGPSVAACAWAMPDRVHSAGVVAGWSEMSKPSLRKEAGDRFMLGLAARAPALLEPIMGLMSVAGRHLPDRVLMAIVAQGLGDSDKKVLANPKVAAAAVASGREAFAQGRVGATDDLRVTVGAWGFGLEDIALPLYLWEGADDHAVPPSVMADYRRISHNQYVEFPGEGHMIFYSRAEEIFRTLVRG